MTEETTKELEIKRLRALVAQEQLAVKEKEIEINNILKEKKAPFFKSSAFVKSFVAGVSLALIFTAYIQYVFIPSQIDLTLKAQTAEYVQKQNEAEYKAKIARLELLKETISIKEQSASAKLLRTKESLKEAGERNKNLLAKLADLEKSGGNKKFVNELKTQIEEDDKVIESKIASVTESQVAIEGISEAVNASAKVNIIKSGWIYVGYHPGNDWNYQTIETTDSPEKLANNTYVIKESVTVRDSEPSLGLLGYKFGKILGSYSPGQRVKILPGVEEVGLSKVWAKVELVK